MAGAWQLHGTGIDAVAWAGSVGATPATSTPTPGGTGTPGGSATHTGTPSGTPGATATPGSTASPAGSATPTHTGTPSATPSATGTPPGVATATRVPGALADSVSGMYVFRGPEVVFLPITFLSALTSPAGATPTATPERSLRLTPTATPAATARASSEVGGFVPIILRGAPAQQGATTPTAAPAGRPSCWAWTRVT